MLGRAVALASALAGWGLISLTAAPPLARLASAGASHMLGRAVALASALAGFGNSA